MKKLSTKKASKKAAKPAKGAKVTKASKAKAASIRASLAKPAKGAKPATNGKGPRENSKLAICAALLTRKEGCTTRDLLTACSWPAISVPATAKAAGLTLRKEKTKGSPTVYFGTAA